MIPQDRTLYLELAKLKPRDWDWLKNNLAQVKRLLEKEMTTAGTVAVDNFELSWDLTD